MSRDIQLSLLGWERACPGICQVESRGAAKHGAATKSFLAPNVKSAGETGRESDLVFEGVAGDFRQNLGCLWIVFLGSEGAVHDGGKKAAPPPSFIFPPSSQYMSFSSQGAFTDLVKNSHFLCFVVDVSTHYF